MVMPTKATEQHAQLTFRPPLQCPCPLLLTPHVISSSS